MTDLKTFENQQELFSQFSDQPRRAERFPSLARAHKPILISVTLEQILMAGIVLVLIFCMVFFLGIVRGKSLGSGPLTPAVSSSSTAPISPSELSRGSNLPTAKSMPALSKDRPLSEPEDRSLSVGASPRITIDNPSKPYSIQLVTYKKRDPAEREAAVLKKLGFFTSILKRGDYFELRAGQYASAEEAKKDLKYFSSKYKGCFLSRR